MTTIQADLFSFVSPRYPVAMQAIRAKFPNPVQMGRQQEGEYCIMGAVASYCLLQNWEIDGTAYTYSYKPRLMPGPGSAARILTKLRDDDCLNAIEDAALYNLTCAILRRNDSGKFDEAWDLLDTVLKCPKTDLPDLDTKTTGIKHAARPSKDA